MTGYTHAEWLNTPVNRYETGGYTYSADIRDTQDNNQSFGVDSLDAPEHIAAGGMHCRLSANLHWLRFGWPMSARRT